MGTFINGIERYFRQRSVLSNLIAINIAVFLILKIVGVFYTLFHSSPEYFFDLFKLPSDFEKLFFKSWTLVTYMFVHFDFWHILFNMLWLYWFGKIFLLFFLPKQMGGIYILGGLLGGVLFVLSYNFFPFFENMTYLGCLIGSSASVMAIVFAAAFYKKDFEIGLLFLGNIKIIYVALISLGIDLLSVTSLNAGGHLAHIGGAVIGIVFSGCMKNGIDITSWINKIIDLFVNLFTKKDNRMYVKYKRFESEYEYNARKNTSNEEIDKILDKIKKSGYGSLSAEEKKKLFDASKN
ncbi:MAG: rhomboid family intramembrane serine protease [Dysgonamonadaceae bacterium]|jgi:membrane associated rhomboid family serine protease|nr:rhomboid family intramembrane serine protease [Dysgonamonadaceae bacterium]